jgi:hypothetical protein
MRDTGEIKEKKTRTPRKEIGGAENDTRTRTAKRNPKPNKKKEGRKEE